ncbi:MAG: putative quinol monooxygenase [Planctomycetota bacterium]
MHRTATIALAAATLVGCRAQTEPTTMYGIIGKMNATPGDRDALAAILVEGVAGMPGCKSYVVANDPTDPDAIWITEVWDSKEAHQASLSLPSVQDAIAKGRPLIAGFGERHETEPIGGHGIDD